VKPTRIVATLSALLWLLVAVGAAWATPPGNNGTVKVHEGSTETEPIVHNQPHVCTFHLHFFFADPAQSGDWWIKSWPPTGDKTVVLSGSYDTNGDGEDRQPETGVYSLPDGHYKLFWQGDESKLIKHKVFWVECEAQPTPTPTPTPTENQPTPTPTENQPTPTPTENQPTPTPTPSASQPSTSESPTGLTHPTPLSGPRPPNTAMDEPAGFPVVPVLLLVGSVLSLIVLNLRTRRS